MSLPGRAFLALWNDIRRSREPEYDRWHSIEHVPERVAVTGFFGARRYVDRARAHHRYFTLYAVESLAVFEHPEYLDLIHHPTPWSAAMRPDFANFLRAACRNTGSSGDGIGAALAILAFEGAHACTDLDLAGRLREQPGVVAVHSGEGSGAASPIPWTRAPAATAPIRPFDRLLMIEALDRPAAAHALDEARAALGVGPLPADFGNGVYDLASVFPGDDPAARRRHRRPGWAPWPEEEP